MVEHGQGGLDRFGGGLEDAACLPQPGEGAQGLQRTQLSRAQTGHHDGDAARLEPVHGVPEDLGPGGVDRGDPGHAEDDDPHVGDLGEFQQEPVGGGEEQRPVDPVGDDVLGQQGLLLVASWSPGGRSPRQLHLVRAGRCGPATPGRAHRRRAGRADRVDEVEGERWRRRSAPARPRRSGWRGPWRAASRPRPCGPRWPAAPRPARPAGSARRAGAAARRSPASTAAWVSAASREPAPERTLTAVRAIAAVAGTPPNSGAARFARPWPNSSRSGSWRSPTLMPSATVADSSDSSAASAATAAAGASERHVRRGRESQARGRAGRAGRSPDPCPRAAG